MNEQIETLNEMINQANNRNSALVDTYKKRLLDQWTKVFENDKQLEKDANNALNASEYGIEEDGVYSWYRVKTNLKEYELGREYLEEYLSDKYGLNIDWKNDCFTNYLGEDNIIIQYDTGRDNGVWANRRCIIPESEYRDEDGTVNETKRNELIEAYMEKEGYFPGVFRVDNYGNVFNVKTR